MHSAPSVSYPVGRCRFAAMLMAGLSLAGAMVLLAWIGFTPGPSWRHALASGVWLVATLAALWAWLKSPQGELRWALGEWSWQDRSPVAGADTIDTAEPGVPSLRLDLQHWLLLSWRGEDRAGLWLWLERSRSPQRWGALRRAVYSRAMTDALRRQDLPPAEP